MLPKHPTHTCLYIALRCNIEFQPDTHAGQLNIEILQHTGHSNGSDVVATAEPDTLAISPSIALCVVTIRERRTSPTPDGQVPATRVLLARVFADSRCSGEEAATATADGGLCVIRAVHQTILEQESGSVGNQSITLHLTDTDTTTLLPSLDGLAGHRVSTLR